MIDFLNGNTETEEKISEAGKEMEILASIAIVAVTTIFIVLSLTIYLTLKIFEGKSINNKEYAPAHATIFDLFFHRDDLYDY